MYWLVLTIIDLVHKNASFPTNTVRFLGLASTYRTLGRGGADFEKSLKQWRAATRRTDFLVDGSVFIYVNFVLVPHCTAPHHRPGAGSASEYQQCYYLTRHRKFKILNLTNILYDFKILIFSVVCKTMYIICN